MRRLISRSEGVVECETVTLKEEVIARLFSALKIKPVIVDIGSAGSRQPVFASLAAFSMILGFDPDARGQDQTFAQGFKERILIPKAVTFDPSVTSIPFTTTKYSSCSSTLTVNRKVTANYIFSENFEPIETISVPATTLNQVAEENHIEAFDWIKVDSQGTDMRILKSLSSGLMNKLLAVDIEPGLVDFYVGEDTFAPTHDFLLSSGFWMSDLQTQSYAYTPVETVKWIQDRVKREDVIHRLEKSPTCIEGRYMRTIQHLEQLGARAAKTAFLFALADDKIGYALEILKRLNSMIGDSATVQLCFDSAMELLYPPVPRRSILQRAKSRLRRVLE